MEMQVQQNQLELEMKKLDEDAELEAKKSSIRLEEDMKQLALEYNNRSSGRSSISVPKSYLFMAVKST